MVACPLLTPPAFVSDSCKPDIVITIIYTHANKTYILSGDEEMCCIKEFQMIDEAGLNSETF